MALASQNRAWVGRAKVDLRVGLIAFWVYLIVPKHDPSGGVRDSKPSLSMLTFVPLGCANFRLNMYLLGAPFVEVCSLQQHWISHWLGFGSADPFLSVLTPIDSSPKATEV